MQRWLDRGLLVIDPTCRSLIADMRQYHYDERSPASVVPVKDGQTDHLCDALRYLVVNLELGARTVAVRMY